MSGTMTYCRLYDKKQPVPDPHTGAVGMRYYINDNGFVTGYCLLQRPQLYHQKDTRIYLCNTNFW